MPSRPRLLVLAAAVAGCTAVGDDGDDEVAVRDAPHASTSAHGAQLPEDEGQVANICDVLPPDGPCACACDQEALVAGFVPPGTCATFYCELLDGRAIAVHGCRPAD